MDHRHPPNGFGSSGGLSRVQPFIARGDHWNDEVMLQAARGGPRSIPLPWSVMLNFFRHMKWPFIKIQERALSRLLPIRELCFQTFGDIMTYFFACQHFVVVWAQQS
jgi:hypothetical protein